MKKTIITILAAFLLASCTEKEDMAPASLVQYEVECAHCLSEYPDMQGEKKTLVSGSLVYEFRNSGLDSAYIRLTKSALVAPFPVRAVIRSGGKVIGQYDGDLDWDGITVKAPLP